LRNVTRFSFCGETAPLIKVKAAFNLTNRKGEAGLINRLYQFSAGR